MTARRFRAKSLQLDALERRDTPSHILAVHQVASPPAFRGSGRATVAQIANVSGGGLQVTSSLYGRAAPLGHYTGQLVVTYSDQTHVSGTAYLANARGDEIDIALNGVYRTPRPKSNFTTGTFAFTITGGAVAEAHATGSGSMRGTIDLNTGNLGFYFTGLVKT